MLSQYRGAGEMYAHFKILPDFVKTFLVLKRIIPISIDLVMLCNFYEMFHALVGYH